MNRRSETWRRSAAAATTAAVGVVTVAGQLDRIVLSGRHLASTIPLIPYHLLGIAGGLGLLVLAVGLWDGKRRAAQVAVAALGLIGAAHLAYGLSPLTAGIDLFAAGFILLNLRAFRRGSEPNGSTLGGTARLVVGTGLYALYALVAIGTAQGTESDNLIAGVSGSMPGGPLIAGNASHPGLLINLAIAGILVFSWVVLRDLLRPALPHDGHSWEEHERAAAIVRDHGEDSLDPFALREDKALFFEGDGFLAYRVLNETAVVSGDPIGPPGSAAKVLTAFARFAEEQGWHVVITAASERYLAEAKQIGLRTLRIGEEAVVDPRGFTLEGRRIRKVRQSVARVERRGWNVDTVTDDEISAGLSRELTTVEAEWRSRQPRLIGFAMTLGRLVGPTDRGGGIYVLGRDPDGRLRSFLRFAPYRGGLSLDLMRRAGEEPNGLTEAMVVAALDHAKQRDLSAVSLNFAGFAHVMAADAVLSRSQRALRWLLRRFHGRFQLERLVRFNAKFLPSWHPRYLFYDGRVHLPLSALRVLQAEAYLPPPELARRRRLLLRAPRWVRFGTAAAAICAALTAFTLLLPSKSAHARPLHVRAAFAHRVWSFTYRAPEGPTRDSSLYLPKDRQVIIRIVGRQGSIRLDPLHRGTVMVPVGHGRIAADVVGPKRFEDELEQLANLSPAPAGHTAPAGRAT